jgi:hypothetical protein
VAEEVLAFCDHLQRRVRPLPGLGDVVALERALLGQRQYLTLTHFPARIER